MRNANKKPAQFILLRKCNFDLYTSQNKKRIYELSAVKSLCRRNKRVPYNLRKHAAHAGQMRQPHFRPCTDMANDIGRRETAEPPGLFERHSPRHAE